MKLLTNRIVVSLIIVVVMSYIWEFYGKPVTGPLYTTAVNEYNAGHYRRSLELLDNAYLIDPNDTDILVLMGWNHLKLNDPRAAEPRFARAYQLAPDVEDVILGYAYAELALGKEEEAGRLLAKLAAMGAASPDIHVARGTMFRDLGQNLEAAREFRLALADDPKSSVAMKNLQEIFDVSGDPRKINLEFSPLNRPSELAFTARVEGDYFAVQMQGTWKRVFLKGVNLAPAMPGHFPSMPGTDPALYAGWVQMIKELGANTIRAPRIPPPGFYRALREFNTKSPQSPLWLVQSVPFPDPPDNDLFGPDYAQACRKEIQDAMDVIHGQGDVLSNPLHSGGVYVDEVAPWVVGVVLGSTWPSYVVSHTNRLHPDQQSYHGAHIEVASGSPTEVFLAQLINYAAEYEEEKYNWQHPLAFLNWPTLDPLAHPTESTLVEEISLRRGLGERVETPPGPYENDDEVALDPTHLRAGERLRAGYFAAYNVYPFYPDFLIHEPRYSRGKDAEGPSSFAAYLEDLQRYHQSMPLLISEFGISSSLGISHFNPSGWNDGGYTEVEQGRLLARMIASTDATGCAGGLIQGWLDDWYRQNWLVQRFEVPGARARLWLNTLTPGAQQGLIGFKTRRQDAYRLGGDASRWPPSQLLYRSPPGQPLLRSSGDRFDRARRLLSLYADSDEAFLYLRFDVEKLDNDGNGKPDWSEANYLIALSTTASPIGSTRLPFVAEAQVPSGINYVIRLGRPEESKILVASAYNPYQIDPVPGLPEQTQLRYRIPFLPRLDQRATFVEMVVEPNRRRYGRDARFYPPIRYSRSPLKWGTLEQGSTEYNTLAQWYANPKTNMVELRIPWGLLQVTDPSSLQVLAGIDRSGTFYTETTAGIRVALLSYRPQTGEVADGLPRLQPDGVIAEGDLKRHVWAPWDSVEAKLYLKDGYAVVQRAFVSVRGRQEISQGGTSPPRGRKTP